MTKFRNMLIVICTIFFISISGIEVSAKEYKYDKLGRLIEVIYDSGVKVSYAYDVGGNILSIKRQLPAPILKSIKAQNSAIELKVGEDCSINVVAEYSDGSIATIDNRKLSFDLVDKTVASINEDGVITALKVGNTAISTLYEGKTALVSLTVISGQDTEKPSIPQSVTSSNIKETSVTLSWSSATDNAGVKGYKVYQDGQEIGQTDMLTLQCINLTPGVSYQFAVKAFDEAGNISDMSSAISVTTLKDTVAPSAPSLLSVVRSGTNYVLLGWKPSTDNVKVKQYEVYLNGKKTFTTTTVAVLIPFPVTGVKYTVYVKAVDSSGNVSAQSNQIVVAK